MFVVIIKLKSHFQLSLIPTTIANAIVPMKLRPILSGQSQITACDRKLFICERDLKVKTCATCRGLRRI